jgi:hypothetical protein
MRQSNLFLVLLLILGCFSATTTTANPAQSDVVAEYAVYSAVLKRLYIPRGVKRLVIEDQTDKTSVNYADSPEAQFKHVKKDIPSLSHIAINDYVEKNRESRPLERAFRFKTSYNLVSRDKFNELAGPNETMESSEVGWAKFYSEYPGSSGFLSLSRVGFDHRKNQALVYIAHVRGHQSGRMWGHGSYVLLIKREGLWRVKDEVVIWVH